MYIERVISGNLHMEGTTLMPNLPVMSEARHLESMDTTIIDEHLHASIILRHKSNDVALEILHTTSTSC